MGIDKMGVDKVGVDEMESRRSGTTPLILLESLKIWQCTKILTVGEVGQT